MNEANHSTLRKILAFTAIAEIATALVLMVRSGARRRVADRHAIGGGGHRSRAMFRHHAARAWSRLPSSVAAGGHRFAGGQGDAGVQRAGRALPRLPRVRRACSRRALVAGRRAPRRCRSGAGRGQLRGSEAANRKRGIASMIHDANERATAKAFARGAWRLSASRLRRSASTLSENEPSIIMGGIWRAGRGHDFPKRDASVRITEVRARFMYFRRKK